MPPVPNWPGAWWFQRFQVVWTYIQDLVGSVIWQANSELAYLETAFQWLG